MQKLEINKIIELINSKTSFEATAIDGSFTIKIKRYVPYCCAAIHAGSNVRSNLEDKYALSAYDRWQEEDPHTDDFIASMPITLIGNDSRYEYDLNKNKEECIYEMAWEKKVWKNKLNSRDTQETQTKHNNFYKVAHALIQKLEELFDACIVYDFHAYNRQRWGREVPLFNLGTERVDTKRYGLVIENWQDQLSKIRIPEVTNATKVNDVFFGRGYFLEYITKNFKNTLVLATEVKKVFCNELTGDEYPEITNTIQHELKNAIINNANYYCKVHTNWKHDHHSKLLDKSMDPALLEVDKQLYSLLKNFELLAFVNPNNAHSEKKKFFKHMCTELPSFSYNPIRINAYSLKQELSNLRVQDISDISIRHLYESVINSYFDKIDLLSTLNTKKFFYNSLRYFGRPSKNDIQNAQYFLHLPDVPGEPKNAPSLDVHEAIVSFEEGLKSYGLESKIELSDKVIAHVMVLNSRKTILFRPDAKFSRTQINSLVEHEIGVHMTTTTNSNEQELKVFNLGLPVNTETQEGLAILSEYLSGNVSMKRLKELSYRVIVADMMCSGADFVECFNYLRNERGMGRDNAYALVTRIFRGGGFTKDYLYLKGFVKVFNFWQDENSLEPLLVGKTSLDFYGTIEEMIEREMVKKPSFITKSFVDPKDGNNHDIYEYILGGLK